MEPQLKYTMHCSTIDECMLNECINMKGFPYCLTLLVL